MLIYHLPDQRALASEQFRQHDLVVICLGIEPVSHRDFARLQIRQSLIEVIAAALGVAKSEVHLQSQQGQAPSAVIGQSTSQECLYLSIAHEEGYALAAICRHYPVGIDVVKISDAFAWKDTAMLYLGKATTQEIAAKPPAQQFQHFLWAWACHEARLKCLGTGLQEWREELAQQLSSIHCEVDYVSWTSSYIVALARQQSDKHNPIIQVSQCQN